MKGDRDRLGRIGRRLADGIRLLYLRNHPDPTEGGLMTDGPYRYIRHPIYAAMGLFAAAGAAGHWSWSAGLCGGLVLASAVIRILCEEALVAARYPEYAQYKATTWRMIPYVY